MEAADLALDHRGRRLGAVGEEMAHLLMLSCLPVVLCTAVHKAKLINELMLQSRFSSTAATSVECLAASSSIDGLRAQGRWRMLSYDALQDRFEDIGLPIPDIRACTVTVDSTPEGRFF